MDILNRAEAIVITGSLDNVPDGIPIIATHDGIFHCDDVFAITLVRLLPEYRQSIVLRSRNKDLLKRANVLVDVGYVFDPETCRFDHHQKGFKEYFDSSIKTLTYMSSVGLVYKYFGKRILKEVYQIPDVALDIVYKRMYYEIIEALDALDNGINSSPTGTPLFKENSTLTYRISRKNTPSNNPLCYDVVNPIAFNESMNICRDEFEETLKYVYNVWYKAKEVVKNAYANRFKTHPSGRIIYMFSLVPVEEHLEECETENLTDEEKKDRFHPNRILFIVYNSAGEHWRLRTIKIHKESFECRLEIPDKYRALTQDNYSAMGLSNIEFVHHAGYMAGTTGDTAAINFAEKLLIEASLYQPKNN